MTKEENAELQRQYKARLYKAGYRQAQIWVEEKTGDLRKGFMRELGVLTRGWSRKRLTSLFEELAGAIEARKEVKRKG